MSLHRLAELSVLDRAELQERMLGNAALADRLLEKFLSAAPHECDDLESSIRLGDSQAVASLAHRHKGTARTLATHRVAAMAEYIETHASTDTAGDLLEMLEQMRRLHDEVRGVVGPTNRQGPANHDHQPQQGANLK